MLGCRRAPAWQLVDRSRWRPLATERSPHWNGREPEFASCRIAQSTPDNPHRLRPRDRHVQTAIRSAGRSTAKPASGRNVRHSKPMNAFYTFRRGAEIGLAGFQIHTVLTQGVRVDSEPTTVDLGVLASRSLTSSQLPVIPFKCSTASGRAENRADVLDQQDHSD